MFDCGTSEFRLLLSVMDTGGGTVRLSRANVDPKHVFTSMEPSMDDAPMRTLTLGGCDAGYVTARLSFSGPLNRAITADWSQREAPSSNVALA